MYRAVLSTQAKILLTMIIISAITGVGVWHIANTRGLRARGRRRNSGDQSPEKGQRRSDKRQLTRQEKKLFAESQKLLSQGKISAGARILEQLSMPREAIQALEDHGMIHEAARILLRMQRPNRAGVIYARHGMWDHASQSFRIANMPLEAAKCAREGNLFEAAIELFEKAERFEDAAECAIAAKDFVRAFRLFLKVGSESKAMQILDKTLRNTDNPGSFTLEEAELQTIGRYLGNGSTGVGLAKALASRNKLGPVILQLLNKGLIKQATDLYLIPQSDIGPALMAEVNYQTCDAQNLADVFVQVKKYTYAGMIFEKLGVFDAAGDAFEKARDIDRAIYCYERGRFDDKVKLLKRQLSEQKSRKNSSEDSKKRFGSANEPLSLEEHVAKHLEKRSVSEPILNSRFQPQTDGDTAELSAHGEFGQNPGSEEDTLTPSHSNAAKRLGEDIGVFSLGVAEDTTTDEPPSHLESEMNPEPQVERQDDKDAEEGNTEESVSDVNSAQKPSDQSRLQAFENCRFIEDFSLAQKHSLWHLGDSESFEAGMTILNYQESPRGLYVITSGQVTCHRMINSKEVYLETIGGSESFGELWLLTELPTTVCFRAKDRVTLRVISREKFSTFLESDGVIARKVYKRFTNRLLRSLLKPRDPLKNQAAS